ncbi:hypothetical protein [Paracoccus benzoatiresistens]|uniref:Uncharacterized protein n=1 Tax=Paracoccus benzoatiresistens TaxID=2997341 RepID=A0ABT4J5M7_9RHOB|nr:hypothetical protein [Paracoccus sp. EF6]MCZ0962399.1 hypothetical protein [Paracoccus sp. EF6]
MRDFRTMNFTAPHQMALAKFYTMEAKACVGMVCHECRFQADDPFIEAVAGAGAIARFRPRDRLTADDIALDAVGVEERDFLIFPALCHGGSIIMLGNPAFGRGGSLAIRVIQHAAAFADVIALILPASFAKTSMQRGINPPFHLQLQVDLPREPFEIGDEVHRVHCVFQIRERCPEARGTPDVQPDFAFVTDLAQANLVIHRVSSRAGVILPCLDAAAIACGRMPQD